MNSSSVSLPPSNMINIYHRSKERTNSLKFRRTLSPILEVKIQSSQVINWDGSMQFCILPFLNFRDLISFESTSNNNLKLSDHSWLKFRSKYYNFDWLACVKERQRNKWNFCLSKALILFLKTVRTTSLLTKPVASAIYQKFEGIANKFPQIGSYIFLELFKSFCPYPQTRLSMIDGSKEMTSSSKDRKRLRRVEYRLESEKYYRASIQIASKKCYGGESLLNGLFEIRAYQAISTDEKLRLIEELMKKAIREGATVAGLIVLDRIYVPHMYPQPDKYDKLQESIAQESALAGDSRAFGLFLDRIPQ